jgi:hypothetical protein
MEAKDFITRPDIMAIYEKEGVTTEVLNSITSVAGYQIAKNEMESTPSQVNEVTPDETPIQETVIEEPITETLPEEEPTVTEPEQTEPEILVEEDEEK